MRIGEVERGAGGALDLRVIMELGTVVGGDRLELLHERHRHAVLCAVTLHRAGY